MEPDHTNDTHAEKEIERLLRSLGSACSDFADNEAQMHRPNTKRITRLFAGWFMGFNPLAANPSHQAFLTEVERIIAELVSVLEKTEPRHPAASTGDAARAVAILLSPKPAREKTSVDWTLTAAEYQVVRLLPYLASDELKSTRAMLLKRTPKRLMFPKQLELIKTIDKGLSRND